MRTASAPAQNLQALLGGLTSASIPALAVTGVELDSRRVAPGQLFFAVPGVHGHGLDHAREAIARGAAAVAWDDNDRSTRLPVPAIRVPGLVEHLGEIAARFYGRPSTRLQVIGITGTDGKTSCAHILAQALTKLGRRCGYIGTLGCGELPHLTATGLTTPDAVRLQAWLARMLGSGVAAVALEASSHALAQSRVAGTVFDMAVLTNIGRDHLDYHGTHAAYAAAKRRLFQSQGLGRAVLNSDDAEGVKWARQMAAELDVVTYGRCDPPVVPGARHLHAEQVASGPQGLAIAINGDWGPLQLDSRLLGRFNASNLLAVLAVLLAGGTDPAQAVAALAEVATVPGRMEVVARRPGQPLAVVDYAHTPGALEQALATVGEHAQGQVHCVFGCGGDRDAGKRALMGAAACAADSLWVTDDNPRSEDPAAITDAILAGVAPDARVSVVHDRAQAIAQAIAAAAPGDVVLVAGKGHECEQEINGERHHFDDREIVRQVLEQS